MPELEGDDALTTSSGPVPVLEVRDVTKTFPGVIANENVSLTLNQGEIHCLLGENGAGKSTLMNVVFGLYQPDSGSIRVRGEEMRFTGVNDAIAQRIGMVHQHFQLIPVFTVVENIILGDELSRRGLIDIKEARRRIRDLEQQYGLSVDPDAKVGDLSVGEQQRVELIKALFREADILILDEPTAVLTPGEVDDFFALALKGNPRSPDDVLEWIGLQMKRAGTRAQGSEEQSMRSTAEAKPTVAENGSGSPPG